MSVNKVILIGNLGGDPDHRTTKGGEAVANFSIATFIGKDKTEWTKVVVFGKTAENVAKYLVKGSKAYVEGYLQTRSWDDKTTGDKKYMTEVVANRVVFLDPKGNETDDPVPPAFE